VRFKPLDAETVERVLLDEQLVTDRQAAKRAAELSEGSVERAVYFADPEFWTFREQLLHQLVSPSAVRLARSVQSFVDEAGKEAAQKRQRLRTVLGFAISYYRERLAEATRVNRDKGPGVAHNEPMEAIIGALDACLASQEQLDRNANLGILIQHWSESLAQPTARQEIATAY
jgi:hypothetical protein